jgi:hypothetical protein
MHRNYERIVALARFWQNSAVSIGNFTELFTNEKCQSASENEGEEIWQQAKRKTGSK